MDIQFEDILSSVGGYGKYQKYMAIFFLIPVSCVLSWIMLDGLFILSIPEHWCYVEDVSNSNLSISEQRDLVSPPADPSCSMYDVNYTEYIDRNFTFSNDTNEVQCSSGWQFDSTYYDSTASIKWNLVCDRRYFRSLILTLQNVGSLIFTPIYGFLADRYGRKRVYFCLVALPSITGVASTLVEDLTTFMVLKTIYGSVMPTMFTIAFILSTLKGKETDQSSPSFSVLKYPRIRKHFLIIVFCRIAFYATYYGPMYNLPNLAGNEFLNFFLLCIVEIPGGFLFWMLMNRVGRRWTAAIGYSVLGLACFGPLTGFQYSHTIFSMIIKLISSGLFMVSEQQSTELFPTVARSFTMNLGKAIGYAVTLLIPFFADLGAYGKDLPFIIMGCISVVTGILVSFLPETLNENLPQTLSDAEELGKDRMFFSWMRRKCPISSNMSSIPELKNWCLSEEEKNL